MTVDTKLETELSSLQKKCDSERSQKEELALQLARLEESKMTERKALEETHLSQLTAFKTKIKGMQAEISKLRGTNPQLTLLRNFPLFLIMILSLI